MNSTDHEQLISTLYYITQQLNRYLSPSILLFGIIGNTLNCLVLSQRTLRTNPCALLFGVSSFIELISIVFGVPSRILAGWNLDPTATNHVLCKLRAFIVFSTRTMGTWLIALATIDRWLLSCVDNHRRQMSTIKNVKKGIIGTVSLGTICFTHMFYCYEANLIDSPLRCYGTNEICRLVTDIIYSLISILIPLILMLVFGLLTVLNVHRIHNRVHNQSSIPTVNNSKTTESRVRKVDHHLLRMLLVQIALLNILCLPQAIQKFHVTFHPLGSTSRLADAIEIFLYNIDLLLAFIASGIPFYIYTLAGGTIFRKAFIDLIRKIF